MNEQLARITKEAEEKYPITMQQDLRISIANNSLRQAYIAGATPYAERLEKLREAVKKAIEDMKYVAYNIDGRTVDDLPKGIIESTSHADTALIVIRDLISALNQ